MGAAETIRRDFLVSIRPAYARKIIEGKKTVELRRRFVQEVDPGAIILIYSTSPIQAIVGYAIIKDVHRLPIRKMWETFGAAACIDRSDFREYFSGLDEGYAILLKDVRRFREHLPVAILKHRFGFVPPQSFRYLSEEYYSLLDDDQFQAPNRYQYLYRPRRYEGGTPRIGQTRPEVRGA